MIDQLSELIAGAVIWIGLAAWRALPVFLVVLVLDRLLRKHVPAKYVCLLWMLVVARLLMPVSLPSALSVSDSADNLFASAFPSLFEPRLNELSHETFTFQNEKGESITVRQPVLPVDASPKQWQAASEQIEVLEGEKAVEAAAQYRYDLADNHESTLDATLTIVGYLMVCGWTLGCLFFAFRGCFAYLRFVMRLRRCESIEDQAVVDRVLRACDRIGVGRRPKVKEVESLSAPAVFGIFCPVICLPAAWREQLTGERLDWVLRHELAHVKRRDGLVLLVASIAKTLHWFHPLSWIAFIKLQHNIERAADEAATSDLSEASIRDYGSLLLEYAAGRTLSRQPATVGLLAMALPRGLQGRIESLETGRPQRRWLVRITMLPLMAFIALSGLTDAKTVQQPAEFLRRIPNIDVALAETPLPRVNSMREWQPDPTSVREVSVNVRKALRKAKELQPGVDAEKFVMSYFASYPVTAEQRDKVTIEDGVMTVVASERQETVMKQMLIAFEQFGLWQVVTELKVIETDVRLLNQFNWSAEDNQTHCRRLNEPPRIDNQEGWEATFSIDASTSQEVLATSPIVEQSVSIPVRATKISRLESERLLHRIQKDPRSNVLGAPKVTMFNGQCAVISDVAQRPFVTDVSVVRGNLQSALQPKISVFEEGWKFRLKPTATEDKNVDLQLVLTHSSIGDVRLANLPRLSSSQSDGDITIQVPTVQSDSIAVKSVLAANEALLVFSPKPYASDETAGAEALDRGKCQVFMIRTQLISDDDFLKSFVRPVAPTND